MMLIVPADKPLNQGPTGRIKKKRVHLTGQFLNVICASGLTIYFMDSPPLMAGKSDAI